MANIVNGKYMGVRCRPELRLALYMRDGFICQHCLEDMSGRDPNDLNLDHLIPQSQGGTNDPTNLFLSCQWCNKRRQDKPIEVFHAHNHDAIVRIVTTVGKPLNRKLAKSIVSERKAARKESK